MSFLDGDIRGAERLGLEVANLKIVLSPRVLEEMDALVPSIWRPIDREAFERDDLVVYEVSLDDVPRLRLSRVAQ